jgi:HAD superfamily hydrolase (TIGR01509 family)
VPPPPDAGALFDLDGVLWDTSALHERAFAQVAAEAGLVPVSYDRLAGRPTAEAWAVVLEANGRSGDAELVARLTAAKQALARSWLRAEPPLSPEIGRVAALAALGVPTGLVTGASAATADIFLAAAGIPFTVVVTAETAPPGKPDPAPYRAAAAGLDRAPAACWVLEDSVAGLASAAGAGCRCVHLTPEGPSCPADHPVVGACVATLAAFVDLAFAQAGAR